jgi:phage-related protein
LPDLFIADNILEDPHSNLPQQQRAIAIYIRHNPDFFVNVDNMIDNNFTKRVLDNKLKKKKAKQISNLNAYTTGLDKVNNYESLRKSLEKRYGSNWQQHWERKLLVESIKDDPYIFDHFKKKFQTTSEEKIAEEIISINRSKQH